MSGPISLQWTAFSASVLGRHIYSCYVIDIKTQASWDSCPAMCGNIDHYGGAAHLSPFRFLYCGCG